MVTIRTLLLGLAMSCATAYATGPDRSDHGDSQDTLNWVPGTAAAAKSLAAPSWSDCIECPRDSRPDGSEHRDELAEAANLWGRLRAGLSLAGSDHKRVRKEIARHTRFPLTVRRITARARPFLHYVLQQVQARDMPADLALLPMLESGFVVVARSHKQAQGLWQLMPATASRFGLEDNWWYESRLDIELSTRAALDYLAFLHRRFNSDWLLALAAYNAGEGRVSRAIASNRKAGRPTDFWHLDLPTETRHYVPRLLAFSSIVAKPQEFGMVLSPIADLPYLESVPMEDGIGFEAAARLASVSVEQIRELNPALKRLATSPENPRLLLPKRIVKRFRVALAEAASQAGEGIRKVEYTVQSGDNLWMIAKQFGISYRQLAHWNGLKADAVLHPGRRLVVWT